MNIHSIRGVVKTLQVGDHLLHGHLHEKMTETIYYMVISSKNKEENTIYMMFSVMEIVFVSMIEIVVTVSTEMTVVTVTESTEEILETIIEMVFVLEAKTNRYYIKQHLTRIASANVMCSLITAKR